MSVCVGSLKSVSMVKLKGSNWKKMIQQAKQ